MEAKECRKVIGESEDYEFKFKAVIAMFINSKTLSKSEAAELSGKGEVEVADWARKAKEEGYQSLLVKRGPGRPRLLSDSQIQEVEEMLKENPEKHGVSYWDPETLSECIERELGVRISARYAQLLLSKLVYSKIYEKNPETLTEDFHKTFRNVNRSLSKIDPEQRENKIRKIVREIIEEEKQGGSLNYLC